MPLTIIMIVFVTYVQNLIRLTQSNIAYLSAYKRDKHIGTSPNLVLLSFSNGIFLNGCF